MNYAEEAKKYQQEIRTYLDRVKRGRRVAKHDPDEPQFSAQAEKVRVLDSMGLRKKPLPSSPHETPLKPEEEVVYQQWKQKYAPNDSGEDYDFRGAFKAGLTPGRDQHWADTYKKPNHPTFSDESVYSGLTGTKPGSWQGPQHNQYVPFQDKKETSMIDPVDLMSNGLKILEMGKGFDVDAHSHRLLSTGPFAEAAARQAVWHPAEEPLQMAAVPIGVGGGNKSASDQLKALGQDEATNKITQQTAPPAAVDTEAAAKTRRNKATADYNLRHPEKPLPLE